MRGESRQEADAGTIVRPASQDEIAGSGLWHFYDYDLIEKNYSLIRIEESLYRQATFLDARIRQYDCPVVSYELQYLAEMFPRLGQSRGPMRFIFHIGHCGSTLLSRALAASQRVLPLREPITLRKLSADHRELDSPLALMARDDWKWLLSTVIDSHSRRFRTDQVNIVKATSTGNNLIAPVLAENPHHRAVLLYLPLENYLATMLSRDKNGGDLQSQSRTRMTDWLGIVGESTFRLHELRRPQLAVLSWLTSLHYMCEAHRVFGERVMMLNFEALIADPATHINPVTSFCGIDDQSELILARFPEIASVYSKKPDTKYTPDTRNRLLRQAREDRAEEILDGLNWAHSLFKTAPQLDPLSRFID